jgi:hypothetical protein
MKKQPFEICSYDYDVVINNNIYLFMSTILVQEGTAKGY